MSRTTKPSRAFALALFWRLYAVVCFCLFTFLLVLPAKRSGFLDNSLFAWCNDSMLRSALVLQLLLSVGMVDIIHRGKLFARGHHQLSALLFLLFGVIVFAQSFRSESASSLLVACNIFLCTTFFLLFYLVAQRLDRPATFPLVIFTIMAVYCVLIIYSFFGGKCNGTERYVYHFDNQARLSLLFEHPNHLGNLVAFGLIICFSTAVMHSKTRTRLFAWSMVTVLIFALIRTYSRGAWFGCTVGICTSLYYLCKCLSPRLVLRSAVILFLIFAAIAAMNSSPHHLARRIIISKPSTDDSVGNRLQLWRASLAVIRDNWLFGVGISRFGDVLEKGYKPKQIKHESYVSALNNYLTIAAEAGIITLIIYLWATIYACREAARRMQRKGWTAGAQIGMLGGVYSMLIFGLTTYTLSRVYANIMIGSVLGYMVSVRRAEPMDCEEITQHFDKKTPKRIPPHSPEAR